MAVYLKFMLEIEDGWPPVGLESLPFEKVYSGYKLLSPPIFVKNLSVGDILAVNIDNDGNVTSWNCQVSSKNSTVWLLRLSETDTLQNCLEKLRAIGCDTVNSYELGCYSINVPEMILISSVDDILNDLDDDKVAIAFPSMRHPE